MERVKGGLRDELVTAALARELEALGIDRARVEPLEPGEGRVRLARHLAEVAARLVTSAEIEDDDGLALQLRRVNALVDALHSKASSAADFHVDAPARRLTGIFPVPTGVERPTLPDHPVIPLTEAELLSNAPGQPSLGQLLRQECRSADRVDLLCAFIGPTGVHTLLGDLEEVVRRGRASGIEEPVRVVTSTWLGATQRRALDMLCKIGAAVHVVYDGTRLRLHAKSWYFARAGRLSTAYVGSSNLSRSALEHGLEWNVRISERTNPGVLDRIHQTFEAYLAEEQFERYLPERDAARLDEALRVADPRAPRERLSLDTIEVGVKPRPYAYQQRILDELHAARHRHDRHRNLVVAATGTGKTVIAAFDYARLARELGGPLPSLLFVAHREEILRQSRATFRSVLGRPEFGEIVASGRAPPGGAHVFANIQSLHEGRLKGLQPDAYDIVIVDEFHHAAADSYGKLLARIEPRELLGLTATPERADGKDVTRFFGGQITSELRLWEAIDQGLLAPFHYFGVDDRIDLRAVRWSRGRYDLGELSNVLSGDRERVRTVIAAMNRYLPSVDRMRALGFCVTVDHARFMAESFRAAGIESEMLHGGDAPDHRHVVLRRLEDPADPLRCVFSVDVLGEGIDVPDVDTVLLLRPTESATVFLQQLGRGLRLAEGKEALTVLDMIGIPHERFRFDRTLATIVDPAGGSLRKQAELGFPFLPSGCEVYFEKKAHERVLANLRRRVDKKRWAALVEELKRVGPAATIWEFLAHTEREIEHLYSGPDRSWGRLRVDAGFDRAPTSDTSEAHRRLYTILHVDDEERVELYTHLLAQERPPDWDALCVRHRRLIDMLLVSLWSRPAQRGARIDAIARLWRDSALRAELRQLLELLGERARRVTVPLTGEGPNPTRVHARYTKEEALIAFCKSHFEQAPSLMPGVYRSHEEKTDFFFVTLRKDERTFTPETRYRDFALGPRRFHWETQHATKANDATTHRYVTHAKRGDHIALFVRETTKSASGAGEPFTFLGHCRYRSHEGSEPVQFVWDLEHDMPADLLEVARLVG